MDLLAAENYNPLLLYFLDDAIAAAPHKASPAAIETFVDTLRKVFARASKSNSPVNPYYSIGKLFYTLDRFYDCIKVCNQSLKQYGEDEKAYYYLAACFEVKGNFQLSLLNYEKALKFNKRCELNRSGKRRVTKKLSEIKNTADRRQVFQILSLSAANS